MSKKYTWYKITDSVDELPITENGLHDIEVGGKKICIAIKNDTIHACAAKCPHAGGSMSHGYVDALGNIVCPLHRYKFSIENGRNTSGEGYFLKTYPIEKRENGIFIGIEEQGLFESLFG
jgi:nitrite reductase/ring-hydroxylating ferredoxin subunit